MAGGTRASLAELQAAFDKLAKQLQARPCNYAACAEALDKIKLGLVELSFLVAGNQTPSPDLLVLSRSVLEKAALVAASQNDTQALARNVAQLSPYYSDYAAHMAPSADEAIVTSLHLLALLVSKNFAQFHTDLELLRPSVRESADVVRVVELERSITDGRVYGLAGRLRAMASDPAAAGLLAELMNTVRVEVAQCVAAAYDTLPLAAAKDMLQFDRVDEAARYAAELGWPVSNGIIDFRPLSSTSQAEIPATVVIRESLRYAKELERIV